MKENKYEDPVFFQKYSQMLRSEQGLAGAGEWHELKKMFPELEGKKVLDLGCGYGWHCIYAKEQGAAEVVGVDLSEKMLEVAREKSGTLKIEYICSAIEDISLPEDTFDLVLSSLAFHYLETFDPVAKKVYSLLKPGGTFVFSCEHPVFTSSGPQDWYYNETGEILHFPVDRYFYEGKREAVFLGEPVIKYHKTITTYLRGLLKNGFELLDFAEPMPEEEMLERLPEMANEMRRPMMMLIAAQKKPM